MGKVECVFDGPQAYYDELVRASRAGEFPATDGFSCAYLTPDGRRCGIGKLWPRRTCETAEAQGWGAVSYWKDEAASDRLPAWLPVADAVRIQNAHDDQFDGDLPTWDHEQFVRSLNDIPVFAGCARMLKG
jgi:hypothetical protein